MADEWFLLQSGPGEPPWNMALDETLLDASMEIKSPVLRFYSWTEPAATFGYSQNFAEIEKSTLLRPLIRRPTGGGLVPHDADWTYSLIFPRGHLWYELQAEESYRRIHAWLRDAFQKTNVETMLSPVQRKEIPGQCFHGAEKNDLLWHGRKIAGAAQRRSKHGLLIQGSVQPPPLKLSKIDWQKAMCDVAHEQWNAKWSELDLDGTIKERARELAAQKYSQPAFNQKR